MKINPKVLSVLSGQMVLISKYSLEQEAQFQDSPLKQSIPLNFGNSEKTFCQECEKENIDWCWNCEKPICPKHAYPLFFYNQGIILNLCEDCRETLLKLCSCIRGLKIKEGVKK